VLEASVYSYFRYQMHRALENVLQVHEQVAEDFDSIFGRRYGLFDEYRLDDADTVLVMMGSFAAKGKAAVNRWRAAGRRVGLLRLRLVRPFPAEALCQVLAGRQALAVIDQNISPGLGGILYHELAGALANSSHRPPVLRSFIGGLGGKDISHAEFDHVLDVLDKAAADEQVAEPELLMTRNEWQQVQDRLDTAGKPTGVSVSCE
jgi:pyruvate ferredoxin oxidoreductase alpha subunit